MMRGAGSVHVSEAPLPAHTAKCQTCQLQNGRNTPGFSCCFRDYVKCCLNEKALFSYTHVRVYFLVIPSGVERPLSLKKIPLQTGTFVVVLYDDGPVSVCLFQVRVWWIPASVGSSLSLCH